MTAALEWNIYAEPHSYTESVLRFDYRLSLLAAEQ